MAEYRASQTWNIAAAPWVLGNDLRANTDDIISAWRKIGSLMSRKGRMNPLKNEAGLHSALAIALFNLPVKMVVEFLGFRDIREDTR